MSIMLKIWPVCVKYIIAKIHLMNPESRADRSAVADKWLDVGGLATYFHRYYHPAGS